MELIKLHNPKVVPGAYHALSYPISSILEDNLAVLMGMETLRHGTTISRAINILSKGTCPNMGGEGASKVAAEKHRHYTDLRMRENCSGRFHVIKDTNFSIAGINNACIKGTSAKAYSAYTAYGLAKKNRKLTAIINFLFSPTIRFHYTPRERKQIFEDDPDSTSMALRTHSGVSLPNDRIGMTGLMKYGSFKGLSNRLCKRPLHTAKAIMGFVVGLFLSCIGIGFFT